jgi:muramoyltetrapeptide carboxypeptidase
MSFSPNRIARVRRLKAGDTIGIVAPAGPFDRELFAQGIAIIQSMGFETKTDERIFSSSGYLAGTDSARAAQFIAMVADRQVQAVMSARGGYGALRIMQALDYRQIGTAAKAFTGFSDMTALHRAIYLKSGLVTFHGPMVTTLARSDEATRLSWYRALTEPVAPPIDLSRARVLKSGIAQGVLTGGNLATLCHLTGTCFGAGFQGHILLLEDIGEAPYRIDRMLTQMKMAGLFDGLAGLVLGSFEDCGSDEEIDALVLERFQDWSIPIVSGAPIGHGRSNWTVPLGIAARLDTAKGELVFVEPSIEE